MDFKTQNKFFSNLDDMILKVKLESIKDLPSNNDCYVRVTFHKQSGRTETIKSKNPVYNQTFTFVFKGLSPDNYFKDSILFQLYNDKTQKVISSYSMKIQDLDYDKDEIFKELMNPIQSLIIFETRIQLRENKIKNIKLSLQEVIDNQISLAYYKNYCNKEQNKESLLFYLDIEEYKKINDEKILKISSEEIKEKYLNIHSPYSLNVSQEMINEIDFNHPSINSFDKIQKYIQDLMKDCFERFLKSTLYQEALHKMKYSNTNSEIVVSPTPSNQDENVLSKIKKRLSYKV